MHKLHPHLPWKTADYWRRNPAVLANDGDQQRSGRPPTFTLEECEYIRRRTLAIPGAGVDDIIPIALRLAEQRAQDLNVAPKDKKRYEDFVASPHWLADFLKKEELSEHVPHPISMKALSVACRQRRPRATQPHNSGACALFLLCNDHRAKCALCRN